MENPDAVGDGNELVKFSWRQNHMVYNCCFTLNFYLKNEEPVLTGWFPDRYGGAPKENGTDAFSKPIPWPVSWTQWYELQNALRELELPEYRKPSPDACDETDSEITVVWRGGDGEITLKLDGSSAHALETQVLSIAQDAYDAAIMEARQRDVSETAKLTEFYWNQSAMTASGCFSFSIGELMPGLMPTDEKQFSYTYLSADGRNVSRTDIHITPEQAQDYLERIERELRSQELPVYHAPGPYVPDATDSYLAATWSDGGESFTNSYCGEGAQSVYNLMVELAEEAEEWFRSRPVPEGGWRCDKCGMPNGDNAFCAECGNKRSAGK